MDELGRPFADARAEQPAELGVLELAAEANATRLGLEVVIVVCQAAGSITARLSRILGCGQLDRRVGRAGVVVVVVPTELGARPRPWRVRPRLGQRHEHCPADEEVLDVVSVLIEEIVLHDGPAAGRAKTAAEIAGWARLRKDTSRGCWATELVSRAAARRGDSASFRRRVQ